MNLRHFITLNDLTADELRAIIHRAIELKAMRENSELYQPLKNKVLAMVFEKSSTRTRISFDAGMTQLGGSTIFLSPRDTQLGRGEPIEDSARVISRMVDGIMLRTNKHETVETFAKHSKVPVINGLTDRFHPCQLLADLQTWFEQRGDIKGKKVCWIGDGNNMCQSYMNAAKLLGFKLSIACPVGYEPESDLLSATYDHVTLCHDPLLAAKDADLVVTDVWASMGQEQEQKDRCASFAKFQVDTRIMQSAKDDALFMHCLPAHRGEEVSADVLDGPQSVVWDEAENRLHAQKALLEFLMQ
ncbi:MAG: ornithine carbamoyltransferase [Cycloclasticus sp. symbiont of Poecilosclerida sp. M]|nr:MAG: ornithine carbamoyltransferase [Cycloclasticus sp. symbiont of Poecilosclerida sp. M]